MKYGIRIKIDVTKIDKAELYRGEKGTYLNATVFMNPHEIGKYGDNGMITQDISKDRRNAGEEGAILGNVKVFWTDEGVSNPPGNNQPSDNSQNTPHEHLDDIPF